jgi:hypothetical protein
VAAESIGVEEALISIANKWEMPLLHLLFPPVPLRNYFKFLSKLIYY